MTQKNIIIRFFRSLSRLENFEKSLETQTKSEIRATILSIIDGEKIIQQKCTKQLLELDFNLIKFINSDKGKAEFLLWQTDEDLCQSLLDRCGRCINYFSKLLSTGEAGCTFNVDLFTVNCSFYKDSGKSEEEREADSIAQCAICKHTINEDVDIKCTKSCDEFNCKDFKR